MTFCKGRRRNINCLLVASSIFLCILWWESSLLFDDFNEVQGHGLDPDHRQEVVGNDVIELGYGGIDGRDLLHDNKTCWEKTNFVYIKEIKCASQTLVNVFRRFGLERYLSFVLPVNKRLYLGWPYLIEDTFYRSKKSEVFNILCDHSIYNEERFTKIMPPDTLYFTSIREPFSQFKSMLNYYNFKGILNISAENTVSEFLHNFDYYDNLYKTHQASKFRYCIPDGLSMSRNLMSYILGFPTGFLPGQPDMTKNETFINEWLMNLEKRFDLVIIVEYFHESMVLLKRLLCWELQDILYFSQNVGTYGYRKELDQTLVDIHRTHNLVDYRLYSHFNKTFHLKLSTIEPEFFEEAQHYKKVLNDVSKFCNAISNSTDAKQDTVLNIFPSKWNKAFDVGLTLCERMKTDLMDLVKKQYDLTYPETKQPDPGIYFC